MPADPRTADRLRSHLDTLGWSQSTLARRLNQDEARIRRWLRGESPVPEKVVTWLDGLATDFVTLCQRHRPPGVA